MIEVGNILYCKKYFFYNCHFFIGDEFEVLDVDDEYVLLKTKKDKKIELYINEKKLDSFNKNYYIWRYLQTKKDYRKSKLQKIYEIQDR